MILLIGDNIIDRYITCDYSQLDQTAAVPRGRVVGTHESPGGAANVFRNLGAMGMDVTFLTYGPLATECQRWLAKMSRGRIADLRDAGWEPPSKTRVVDTQGRLIARFDNEMNSHQLSPGKMIKEIDEAFEQTPWLVVLSDYGKGTLSDHVIRYAIDVARHHNIPIIVDPYVPHADLYHGATLVKPNARQAIEMWRTHDNSSQRYPATALRDLLGYENVLVTDGAQPATLQTRDQRHTFQPPEVQVVDTTGAGDVVTAALAFWLCDGQKLEVAAERAVIAASLAVTRRETDPVYLSEMWRACTAAGACEKRVVSLDRAVLLSVRVRAVRQTVVCVNGAFDLCHSGHRHLLQTARKHGDFLIALVNRDAAVTAAKGAGRPIMNCEERMLAVAPYVDLVVPIGESPEAALSSLRPAVVVRGESARPEAEQELLRGMRCRLEVVPTVHHVSTTQLLGAHI